MGAGGWVLTGGRQVVTMAAHEEQQMHKADLLLSKEFKIHHKCVIWKIAEQNFQ